MNGRKFVKIDNNLESIKSYTNRTEIKIESKEEEFGIVAQFRGEIIFYSFGILQHLRDRNALLKN